MRRPVLVGAAVLLSVALWPAPASAAPPTHESFDDVFTGFEVEICPFPVAVEGRNSGRAVLHHTNSGQLKRVNLHGTEELTYSANGQTLVAKPFPYNFHIIFGPDGQLEHYYLTGLVLRVPLPDGTTFLSAGRLDFEVTGESFAITPQVGRSGDVEALCDALS
ncbi:hypothetical protein PU560_16985 [Georgenia sp. 10Sc9-8]|uniref:Uncharacterized protein n=1 Tax=Georgenia halotolerans TaxID=3028317 RepID=A0ABT5U1E1_9MICO|nr:hypothetical protein [Georgenia halotolerans]